MDTLKLFMHSDKTLPARSDKETAITNRDYHSPRWETSSIDKLERLSGYEETLTLWPSPKNDLV